MLCTISNVTFHDCFEDIMMHVVSLEHVQNQQTQLLQPLFQSACEYLNFFS